jgi:tyrosyl-tRNA synthetase
MKTKTIDITAGEVWPIIDILVSLKISKSKSEAKRMIQQKAVDIKNEDGTIYVAELTGDNSWIHNHAIVKYGKHTFKKIVFKDVPKMMMELTELEPGDSGYEPD